MNVTCIKKTKAPSKPNQESMNQPETELNDHFIMVILLMLEQGPITAPIML